MYGAKYLGRNRHAPKTKLVTGAGWGRRYGEKMAQDAAKRDGNIYVSLI